MHDVNGVEQMVILANLTSLRTSGFRERVEIAAEAGFDAIGLGLAEYRKTVAASLSPKEMKAILDANGIRVAELEVVYSFGADLAPLAPGRGGAGRHTTAANLREFWSMAEIFEPRHLQTIGSFKTSGLGSDAVNLFADLCDRAADFGLKIALEFVPTTNVPDARVALDIVEQADRPNGCLCVDVWHHVRGAADLDLLRAIPSHRLALIQLSDGPLTPAHPDFLFETMHFRTIPGEGEFDLHSFFCALFDSGKSAPISLEVISDKLAVIDAPMAAAHLMRGTSQTLSESTRHRDS